jgi:hypothetical protein
MSVAVPAMQKIPPLLEAPDPWLCALLKDGASLSSLNKAEETITINV